MVTGKKFGWIFSLSWIHCPIGFWWQRRKSSRWPSRLSWNSIAFPVPFRPFARSFTLRPFRRFGAMRTKEFAGSIIPVKKMFKCTDGIVSPRALLRCLPSLFSGERCELFSRAARIYTHTAQYSDHCNVPRTMPIYIREICRFFVPPTPDSLIYVYQCTLIGIFTRVVICAWDLIVKRYETMRFYLIVYR